jgi:hypothetical protein
LDLNVRLSRNAKEQPPATEAGAGHGRTARFKEPRQPERVMAYLIKERNHRQHAARLGSAVPGCNELRHQLFGVPALN